MVIRVDHVLGRESSKCIQGSQTSRLNASPAFLTPAIRFRPFCLSPFVARPTQSADRSAKTVYLRPFLRVSGVIPRSSITRQRNCWT